MRNAVSSKRKCSALLAAGAGVAVCLTGGGRAVGVTGNVSSLNGGQKTFTAPVGVWEYVNIVPGLMDSPAALNSNTLGRGAQIWLPRNHVTTTAGPGTQTTSRNNHIAQNGLPGGYLTALAAGVTVGPALPAFTSSWGYLPHSLTNKYFAVAFATSLTTYDYGWLEVVSTSANGKIIQFGKWGYNATGAAIKTLAGSVITHQVGLSDGRVKLLWNNGNEDGVARYEVQVKDVSGAWHAVDSTTPGEGRYATTLAGGSECRLLVENVDGATQEIAF